MFFWRGFYCSNLATEGSKIPPLEIYETMVYEKTYNEVCGGGPGFIPIIVSTTGMWYGFKGWALSGVHKSKNS